MHFDDKMGAAPQASSHVGTTNSSSWTLGIPKWQNFPIEIATW